jgi:hypothetical protein
MKRLFFTYLLLASSAFGNPMFTVGSDALNGIVNEPYTAKVTVSGVTDFSAYQFDLVYSSNLFAVSVTETGQFASDGIGLYGYTIDNDNGRISSLLEAMVADAAINGSDQLMQVVFLPLAPGPAFIQFENNAAYNVSFDEIPAAWAGLNFEVLPQDVPDPSVPEPGGLVLGGLGFAVITARLKKHGKRCD